MEHCTISHGIDLQHSTFFGPYPVREVEPALDRLEKQLDCAGKGLLTVHRLQPEGPASKPPETAACAAMRLTSGLIVAGHRHHDCLLMVAEAGLSRIDATHGFMTTLGRFVDRIEALTLQKAAGIASVDPDGYRGSGLFSEDLY